MDEQTIAFMIWLQDYWNDDEGSYLASMPSDRIASLHRNWVENWVPSVNQPHCGDCTNQPCPCTRCHMEGVLEAAKRFANALNS